MSSITTAIADLAPYMFAAVGLEVLSARIRKLNTRVDELKEEVARLRTDEPRRSLLPPPTPSPVERQKERTRQFLEERERRAKDEGN